MKKRILFFLLISNTCFIHAQTYFNFRFEFDQTIWWDGATNIFGLPDGYVIGGGTSYFSPMGLGFYKIDFEGNMLFSKVYADTSDEYYLGCPGSIIRMNDTLIIASGSRNSEDPNTVHQEGLLYFLNNNFDTLFTRSFGDKISPVDTSYLLYQIKKVTNQDVISVGSKTKSAWYTKILLIKTDYLGNLIWEKEIGSGDAFMVVGYSVVCTSDGGFAIGGYQWKFLPPPNLSGDPVVVKTDSAGNLQWYYIYGSPYVDTQGMICHTMDNMMILGFAYCDSMTGGNPHMTGHPYRRINLIKLDNAGNIIWDKKYGNSEEDKTLFNIRENEDGTLISTGFTTQFFTYAYRYVGWMMKTDTNGEMIWYRQYNIGEGESTWHWLYDALETPDKGYLACGVVYAQPPDTGSQDGWAIKVDSLGCENPNMCWVGIKPETELTSGSSLKIFPNPAEKHVTIKMQGLLQRKRITIRLYDLFGREVESVSLPPGQTGCRIDVSSLPEGLYMAVVESEDKILAKEKIMKYP